MKNTHDVVSIFLPRELLYAQELYIKAAESVHLMLHTFSRLTMGLASLRF